jgi:hypothetical protein
MKKGWLLAVAIFPACLFAQGNFEIKGKIGHWNAPAQIYLVYMNNQTRIVDSARITDGAFTINGSVPELTMAWLMLDRTGAGYLQLNPTNTDYTGLYVYDEKIMVQSADSLKNIIVSGSAINDEGIRYFAFLNKKMAKMNALTAEWAGMPLEQRMDPVFQVAWKQRMAEANKEGAAAKKEYIRQYPASFFSLLSLVDLVAEKQDAAEVASLYQLLSPTLRNGRQGQQLAASIEALRNTSPGKN